MIRWISVLLAACLLIACSDDEPASTTPLPASATAAPSPGPTPAASPPLPGPQLPPLSFGAEAEFPEDLLLVVLPGCGACDSPPETLYRVYRNSGEVHAREIYHEPGDFGGRTEPRQPYLIGFTSSSGLAEIVTTVCTAGYCGGVAEADLDHEITLYASTDSGISWAERTARRFDEFNIVVQADGATVLFPWDDIHAMQYADGTPFPVPPEADRVLHVAAPRGLLFGAGTKVLRADGSLVVDIPEAAEVYAVLDEDGEPAVSVWVIDGTDRSPGALPYALTTEGPAGLYGFRSDDEITPVAWLGESTLLAYGPTPDLKFGNTPLLIDIANGVVHPVYGVFTEEPFRLTETANGLLNRSNVIIGFAFGPFLRVESGDDCLNVRASAGLTAEVLDCLADGVLVHDLGNSINSESVDWANVRLLDGREGWAAAGFLNGD